MNETTIEPGIYADISNEQYHASQGISKSGIVKLLRSPRHYWAAYLDPEREPFEETTAMKIGSAAHKLILEPDDFYDEFTRMPAKVEGMNANRKDYKEAKAVLEEKGLTVLKKDQMQMVEKMADRVHAHPEAGPMLSGGLAEQSFYWIDQDTGVLCKCRPDYWIPGIALPDLKTTTDARDDEFAKSCGKFTYHIQAAFYADGVKALTGDDMHMPFIAVEKELPYELNVFWIEPADVSLGRSEYKRALEIYAECVEKDDWPGYPTKVRTISLPGWYSKGK